MDFGYFTLSDNRYPGSERTPERLIGEIYQQALHAEELGFNSAWIGEHHFNRLGVNSCPHILLAQLAGATSRIRLAPGVVVLPIHHPLMVAAEWATLDLLSGGRVDFAAGRGFDVKEFEPFGAPFHESAELFEEGMEIVWRAWTEPGRWSHKGRFYRFDDIEVRPRPHQQPLRPHIGSFSRVSLDMAARNDWHIVFAPFAAAIMYGSLGEAVETYREACARHGNQPRRSSCSYFIHIADDARQEAYARERLTIYFKEVVLGTLPQDPAKIPPNLRYFLDIVALLKDMKPGDLTSKSILLGPPETIIEDLKTVEASGISEVVLYFNFGNKPHQMVKEQMARFMAEVAPAFDGAHQRIAAAG